jgi:hypothetical protein
MSAPFISVPARGCFEGGVLSVGVFRRGVDFNMGATIARFVLRREVAPLGAAARAGNAAAVVGSAGSD